MLVNIEDDSVEEILVAEFKDILARADVGISKKGVKSLLWVLKWYSVPDEWDEYKQSDDYKHLKKVFQL